MTDPLIVEPLEAVLAVLREYEKTERYWQARGSMDDLDRPHIDSSGKRIVIAPDIYHKANISGGPPYEMRAPSAHADGRLFNIRVPIPPGPNAAVPYDEVEVNEMFVDYLRRSFEWAGFPGYAFHDAPGFERIKPILTELLPI